MQNPHSITPDRSEIPLTRATINVAYLVDMPCYCEIGELCLFCVAKIVDNDDLGDNDVVVYHEIKNQGAEMKKSCSWEGRFWPDEVLGEIFARLEAKPLARCKLLNKQWYMTISSKVFQLNHIQNMKAKNKHFMLYQLEFYFTALFYDAKLSGVAPNGRIVSEDQRPVEFLASTHGLATICDKFDNFYLWNPSTLKTCVLPKCQIEFPENSLWAQVFFSLAYYSDVDDYMLVRISLFDLPDVLPDVSIYSRNADVWVSGPKFPDKCPLAQPGVFVAGKLHWRSVIYLNQYHIVAFDVKKLNFSRIPMPDVPAIFGIQDLVHLDDNTLAVSCSPLIQGASYTIWILKDYNDHSSWFKVVIDLTAMGLFINDVSTLQPLNYKKPGCNLIRFRFDLLGYFAIYNIQEGTLVLEEDTEEIEEEGYMTVFKCVSSLHSPIAEPFPSMRPQLSNALLDGNPSSVMSQGESSGSGM